ncbi:hypothetical protein HanIR_Chr17g0895781 [Helianthus annuus]|nr:hypothetical protein HanIR_Chr17g0895781 [Helianthus annuus]
MEMLESLELKVEERVLSVSELEDRAECKRFIMDVDRAKVMDMKQRSMVKWAVDGDENTTYFHNIVNANQSSNRINGLIINGVWETDPPLIKDSICSFFAHKFIEPLPARPSLTCPYIKQISEVDGEMLAALFSLPEIKDVVWDCGGDKAPGPDGINFRFIRRFWGSLQAYFVKVFEEFSGTQLSRRVVLPRLLLSSLSATIQTVWGTIGRLVLLGALIRFSRRCWQTG